MSNASASAIAADLVTMAASTSEDSAQLRVMAAEGQFERVRQRMRTHCPTSGKFRFWCRTYSSLLRSSTRLSNDAGTANLVSCRNRCSLMIESRELSGKLPKDMSAKLKRMQKLPSFCEE